MIESAFSLETKEFGVFVKKIQEEVRGLLHNRVSVLYGSLKINLFSFIIHLIPNEEQISKLSRNGVVGVQNKSKVDMVCLDSRFFASSEWKVEKNKEETFDDFQFLSEKMKFILDFVKIVYANRVDKEYARKILLLDPMDNIEEHLIPNEAFEKILFVSQYPFLLEQVELVLLKNLSFLKSHHVVKINGSVVDSKRHELKVQFESKKFAICFLSLKTGATGLTLTKGRNMIILEPNWDHTWFYQCMFRQYRIGQERDVFCFMLVMGHKIIQNNGSFKVLENANQGSVHEISLKKDLLSRKALIWDVLTIEGSERPIQGFSTEYMEEIWEIWSDKSRICSYRSEVLSIDGNINSPDNRMILD